MLPQLTETLPVAEAARRCLMGIHGRLTEKNGIRGHSSVLSGKDATGNPLQGHRHAYYLPSDEDNDGRLDHLTVYAAGGFGPSELRVFDRCRIIKTGRRGEESHPLRVLLLGMGSVEEYHPGPLKSSSVWVSATPYLVTRHPKARGKHRVETVTPEGRLKFLSEDLRTQLAAVRPDLLKNGRLPVTIEPCWDENKNFKVAGRWRPIQFKRFRHKSGDDGGWRLSGAFRLVFERPVAGPLVVGWSSHFGMGLFAPEDV